MPFTNIPDLTADLAKYVSKAKAELKSQMKDNKILKFYYYDGLPTGAGNGQMFLFGKVPPADLKILKDKSKTHA